jgi:uncharacterized protein (UPF0335 family)
MNQERLFEEPAKTCTEQYPNLKEFYAAINKREEEASELRSEINDCFDSYCSSHGIDKEALKLAYKLFKALNKDKRKAEAMQFEYDKMADLLITDNQQPNLFAHEPSLTGYEPTAIEQIETFVKGMSICRGGSCDAIISDVTGGKVKSMDVLCKLTDWDLTQILKMVQKEVIYGNTDPVDIKVSVIDGAPFGNTEMYSDFDSPDMWPVSEPKVAA